MGSYGNWWGRGIFGGSWFPSSFRLWFRYWLDGRWYWFVCYLFTGRGWDKGAYSSFAGSSSLSYRFIDENWLRSWVCGWCNLVYRDGSILELWAFPSSIPSCVVDLGGWSSGSYEPCSQGDCMLEKISSMSQAHGLLELYELGWLPRIRVQLTKELSFKCYEYMHCLFHHTASGDNCRCQALTIQDRPVPCSIRVIRGRYPTC